FRDIVSTVVAPTPEYWPFRNAMFEEQLREMTAKRVIVAVHDLNVRPMADLTQARRAMEEKFSGDRKSTRLNSSHVAISYAVFCIHRHLRSFPTRRSSDLVSRHRLDRRRPDARVLAIPHRHVRGAAARDDRQAGHCRGPRPECPADGRSDSVAPCDGGEVQRRSEEHTTELQSRGHLVCRLLHPPSPPLFPYTTLFRSSFATSSRPSSPRRPSTGHSASPCSRSSCER